MAHEGLHILLEDAVLHAGPDVLELLAPKQLIDGAHADIQQRRHFFGGQNPRQGLVG